MQIVFWSVLLQLVSTWFFHSKAPRIYLPPFYRPTPKPLMKMYKPTACNYQYQIHFFNLAYVSELTFNIFLKWKFYLFKMWRSSSLTEYREVILSILGTTVTLGKWQGNSFIQVNSAENIRQLKILGSFRVTLIHRLTAIYRTIII